MSNACVGAMATWPLGMTEITFLMIEFVAPGTISINEQLWKGDHWKFPVEIAGGKSVWIINFNPI